MTFTEPEDRWTPQTGSVLLTGGPERIYDDKPTEDTPRPAGFGAHIGRVLLIDEAEPLLWEGDQA